MASVTINLEDEEIKLLEKRAKKNFLTLKEQIEDIIRRSSLSYKKKSSVSSDNVDDNFIKIFSRSKRGRKRKV